MSRPLLMRLLPDGLKIRAYWRLYHHRQRDWPGLFQAASLRFAPGIAMHDLVPGDVISGSIAFTGLYEQELSRRMLAQARHGGLMLDVGANMGYFSLLWAAAHPENRVIAFEASAGPARRLEQNVSRNGLSGQVRILHKAASDANGNVTFWLGPAEQTGWGGIAPADGPDQEPGRDLEKVTVEAVRIDEVVGTEPIAVMKIDVEGAEPLVLRGCRRILEAQQVACVYYECNQERLAALGFTAEDIHHEFKRAGYVCRALDASQTEWVATPGK